MTYSKRQYRAGARAAQAFLCRTQSDLRERRQFQPAALRWEFAFAVGRHAPDYRAGFLDAISVYVLTALEGVLVNPHRWDVLDLLERKEN